MIWRAPATDYASKIIVQEGATTRIAYQDALPGTAIDASADGSHALFIREALAGGHGNRRGRPRERCRADARAARRQTRRGHLAAATRPMAASSSRPTAAPRITWCSRSIRNALAILATYHQTQPDDRAGHQHRAVAARRSRRDHGRRGRRLDRARPRCALARGGRRGQDAAQRYATLGLGTEIRFRLGAGTFTADGAHFAIGLSTPEAPDEIFLADTATGVIARAPRPRPTLAQLPPITTSIEHVTAFDGLAIPVNVYRPQRPGRLPVIVSFGSPEASSPFEVEPDDAS